MNRFGDFLKMEAYSNVKSKMLPSFTEEIARIRALGDYSQEALEKSKLSSIVMAHSGMNIIFHISPAVKYNAFFKIPSMDGNHPFFTQMGLHHWFGSESGISLINDNGPIKGNVDIKNYRVSGDFSKIELNIVISHVWMKDRTFDDQEISEVIMHEMGHAFTYLQLLGGLIRDSWLISNAAKVVVNEKDPEIKKKVLVRTKEQLGADELNYESLMGTSSIAQKDTVELVLVSNSLIKGSSNSGTMSYDARTVEQIADGFVAYNGGGRGLASALTKIYKKAGYQETWSTPTYIVAELFKVLMTLVFLFNVPLPTILYLISIIPSRKVYDDPETRLKTLKQQCLAAYRQEKDPEMKKQIEGEIDAIDASMKHVTDRRTVYQIIFDALTPVGRKRYNQEKQQEAIKALLFNELQLKADKWRKENV